MADQREVLVFDTGPLSHFALAGWLGMLRLLVGEREAVIPDTVVAELQDSVQQHVHLQTVLDASWIQRKELESVEEIRQFAHFSSLLVANGRNRGEAGVLAYAKANSVIAVVDDGAARKAAKDNQVSHLPTLRLLCEAVRAGHATVDLVSHMADHLLETEYRLPFKAGGFAQWAEGQSLLGPGSDALALGS